MFELTGPAYFDTCLDGFHVGQLFTMTKNGFIMTDENLCLDAPQYEEKDSGVRLTSCSEQDRQKWRYEGGKLIHVVSGQCLSVPTAGTSDQVTVQTCEHSAYQEWTMEAQEWQKLGRTYGTTTY